MDEDDLRDELLRLSTELAIEKGKRIKYESALIELKAYVDGFLSESQNALGLTQSRLLDLCVRQQKEIDRLREGLDRLVRIYESEQDVPMPCERPAWLRDLLTK
jgi:hypothetical protein